MFYSCLCSFFSETKTTYQNETSFQIKPFCSENVKMQSLKLKTKAIHFPESTPTLKYFGLSNLHFLGKKKKKKSGVLFYFVVLHLVRKRFKLNEKTRM